MLLFLVERLVDFTTSQIKISRINILIICLERRKVVGCEKNFLKVILIPYAPELSKVCIWDIFIFFPFNSFIFIGKRIGFRIFTFLNISNTCKLNIIIKNENLINTKWDWFIYLAKSIEIELRLDINEFYW